MLARHPAPLPHHTVRRRENDLRSRTYSESDLSLLVNDRLQRAVLTVIRRILAKASRVSVTCLAMIDPRQNPVIIIEWDSSGNTETVLNTLALHSLALASFKETVGTSSGQSSKMTRFIAIAKVHTTDDECFFPENKFTILFFDWNVLHWTAIIWIKCPLLVDAANFRRRASTDANQKFKFFSCKKII